MRGQYGRTGEPIGGQCVVTNELLSPGCNEEVFVWPPCLAVSALPSLIGWLLHITLVRGRKYRPDSLHHHDRGAGGVIELSQVPA